MGKAPQLRHTCGNGCIVVVSDASAIHAHMTHFRNTYTDASTPAHLRVGDGVDDGRVGLHVVEEVHLHPVDRLPVRLFGGVECVDGEWMVRSADESLSFRWGRDL